MLEGRDRLLGWATDSLVELDPLAPGLIGRVLSASPRRRQAIFTVLASRLLTGEDSKALARVDNGDDANLAFVLREGRAHEILAFAFGSVPDGWLGALERLGGQPMGSLRTYAKLHAAFADPTNSKMATALRYVGQISEKMLSVIDALDDRWMHSETLKRLPNMVAAKDFNRAIAFAQSVSSRATDEAIVQAITRLRPNAPLSAVIGRFIRRADRFPAQPLIADAEIRPFVSVRDFIDGARRYRNCLDTKIDEALAGQVAFAEFRGECIIEFRPLTLERGWLLHDVHVVGNAFVDDELHEAVRSRLDALGIPRLDGRDTSEDWRRYRRFVRHVGWN